jgi:hypothetical protein
MSLPPDASPPDAGDRARDPAKIKPKPGETPGTTSDVKGITPDVVAPGKPSTTLSEQASLANNALPDVQAVNKSVKDQSLITTLELPKVEIARATTTQSVVGTQIDTPLIALNTTSIVDVAAPLTLTTNPQDRPDPTRPDQTRLAEGNLAQGSGDALVGRPGTQVVRGINPQRAPDLVIDADPTLLSKTPLASQPLKLDGVPGDLLASATSPTAIVNPFAKLKPEELAVNVSATDQIGVAPSKDPVVPKVVQASTRIDPSPATRTDGIVQTENLSLTIGLTTAPSKDGIVQMANLTLGAPLVTSGDGTAQVGSLAAINATLGTERDSTLPVSTLSTSGFSLPVPNDGTLKVGSLSIPGNLSGSLTDGTVPVSSLSTSGFSLATLNDGTSKVTNLSLTGSTLAVLGDGTMKVSTLGGPSGSLLAASGLPTQTASLSDTGGAFTSDGTLKVAKLTLPGTAPTGVNDGTLQAGVVNTSTTGDGTLKVASLTPSGNPLAGVNDGTLTLASLTTTGSGIRGGIIPANYQPNDGVGLTNPGAVNNFPLAKVNFDFSAYTSSDSGIALGADSPRLLTNPGREQTPKILLASASSDFSSFMPAARTSDAVSVQSGPQFVGMQNVGAIVPLTAEKEIAKISTVSAPSFTADLSPSSNSPTGNLQLTVYRPGEISGLTTNLTPTSNLVNTFQGSDGVVVTPNLTLASNVLKAPTDDVGAATNITLNNFQFNPATTRQTLDFTAYTSGIDGIAAGQSSPQLLLNLSHDLAPKVQLASASSDMTFGVPALRAGDVLTGGQREPLFTGMQNLGPVVPLQGDKEIAKVTTVSWPTLTADLSQVPGGGAANNFQYAVFRPTDGVGIAPASNLAFQPIDGTALPSPNLAANGNQFDQFSTKPTLDFTAFTSGSDAVQLSGSSPYAQPIQRIQLASANTDITQAPAPIVKLFDSTSGIPNSAPLFASMQTMGSIIQPAGAAEVPYVKLANLTPVVTDQGLGYMGGANQQYAALRTPDGVGLNPSFAIPSGINYQPNDGALNTFQYSMSPSKPTLDLTAFTSGSDGIMLGSGSPQLAVNQGTEAPARVQLAVASGEGTLGSPIVKTADLNSGVVNSAPLFAGMQPVGSIIQPAAVAEVPYVKLANATPVVTDQGLGYTGVANQQYAALRTPDGVGVTPLLTADNSLIKGKVLDYSTFTSGTDGVAITSSSPYAQPIQKIELVSAPDVTLAPAPIVQTANLTSGVVNSAPLFAGMQPVGSIIQPAAVAEVPYVKLANATPVVTDQGLGSTGVANQQYAALRTPDGVGVTPLLTADNSLTKGKALDYSTFTSGTDGVAISSTSPYAQPIQPIQLASASPDLTLAAAPIVKTADLNSGVVNSAPLFASMQPVGSIIQPAAVAEVPYVKLANATPVVTDQGLGSTGVANQQYAALRTPDGVGVTPLLTADNSLIKGKVLDYSTFTSGTDGVAITSSSPYAQPIQPIQLASASPDLTLAAAPIVKTADFSSVVPNSAPLFANMQTVGSIVQPAAVAEAPYVKLASATPIVTDQSPGVTAISNSQYATLRTNDGAAPNISAYSVANVAAIGQQLPAELRQSTYTIASAQGLLNTGTTLGIQTGADGILRSPVSPSSTLNVADAGVRLNQSPGISTFGTADNTGIRTVPMPIAQPQIGSDLAKAGLGSQLSLLSAGDLRALTPNSQITGMPGTQGTSGRTIAIDSSPSGGFRGLTAGDITVGRSLAASVVGPSLVAPPVSEIATTKLATVATAGAAAAHDLSQAVVAGKAGAVVSPIGSEILAARTFVLTGPIPMTVPITDAAGRTLVGALDPRLLETNKVGNAPAITLLGAGQALILDASGKIVGKGDAATGKPPDSASSLGQIFIPGAKGVVVPDTTTHPGFIIGPGGKLIPITAEGELDEKGLPIKGKSGKELDPTEGADFVIRRGRKINLIDGEGDPIPSVPTVGAAGAGTSAQARNDRLGALLGSLNPSTDPNSLVDPNNPNIGVTSNLGPNDPNQPTGTQGVLPNLVIFDPSRGHADPNNQGKLDQAVQVPLAAGEAIGSAMQGVPAIGADPGVPGDVADKQLGARYDGPGGMIADLTLSQSPQFDNKDFLAGLSVDSRRAELSDSLAEPQHILADRDDNKDGSISESARTDGPSDSEPPSSGPPVDITFNTKYVEEIGEAIALVRSEATPTDSRANVISWREFFEGAFRSIKRKRYTVRESETLATIARRMFKDKRLAELIRLLNAELLGEDVPLDQIKLSPGMELLLPTPDEILQYRVEVLGELNADLFGGGKASSILKAKQEKPENRRPAHVCRLWDNLQSIAEKHPKLQDERLWKLVAVLNALSTEQGANGLPVAKLKRGQVLILPSAKDIRDYWRVTSGSFGTAAPDVVQDAPATMFGEPAQEALDLMASTVRTSPVESYEIVGQKVIELGSSRICSVERRFETKTTFQMKLEILHEGEWRSVVEYVIGEEHSELHSFALSGVVKIIRMALPMHSVRELAECDLATNYGEYCNRFAQGRSRI